MDEECSTHSCSWTHVPHLLGTRPLAWLLVPGVLCFARMTSSPCVILAASPKGHCSGDRVTPSGHKTVLWSGRGLWLPVPRLLGLCSRELASASSPAAAHQGPASLAWQLYPEPARACWLPVDGQFSISSQAHYQPQVFPDAVCFPGICS